MKTFLWLMLIICVAGFTFSFSNYSLKVVSASGWGLSMCLLMIVSYYHEKFTKMRNLYLKNRDENAVFFAGVIGELKKRYYEVDEINNHALRN